MSEYRLVMKGVVKTFPGVKALDHAQLELRPGKVMALMGENGAGKSTLMKCMFGIYKMDEGEIEYEGEKVTITTPLDALNRGIAMVHFSAADVVRHPLVGAIVRAYDAYEAREKEEEKARRAQLKAEAEN